MKIPQPRYYLKSSTGTKPTLIFLTFRYNGSRLKYSTGLYVNPKHWDKKNQRIKNGRYDEDLSNDYEELRDAMQKASKAVIKAYKNNPEISPNDLKIELDIHFKGIAPKELRKEKGRPENLFHFIDTYIAEAKKNPQGKRGTYKVWITTKNHLEGYCKLFGLLDNGVYTLSYKDLSMTWRNRFVNEYMYEHKKLSINFASKVMTVINQFINEINERDLPTYWGYDVISHHKKRGWLIPKVKTTKFRLNFDQLHLLYSCEGLTEREEQARDMFLIGAYSGLRYSDFSRIKPHHIITKGELNLIEIETQKTGTMVTVPCLPVLKEILHKYNYSPPFQTNQELNRNLKEVGRKAGLNEEIVKKESQGGRLTESKYKLYELLSSHVARRSYCSNLFEMGISAARLMLISGHSTERQFFNYICIDGGQSAIDFAKEVEAKMIAINQSKMRVV